MVTPTPTPTSTLPQTAADHGNIQRWRVVFDIYFADRYSSFENYRETRAYTELSNYGLIGFFPNEDTENLEDWMDDDHNEVVRWIKDSKTETLKECLAELSKCKIWDSSKEIYKRVIVKWFDPEYLSLRPYFKLIVC